MATSWHIKTILNELTQMTITGIFQPENNNAISLNISPGTSLFTAPPGVDPGSFW